MPSKNLHSVTASAFVHASADCIYAILADYRKGHPRILPSEFTDLTVESGGFGDGTVIRCQMRVFGRTQTFRAAITEPVPGRVLVETLLDQNHTVTTFTVDAAYGPNWSRVAIETKFETRPGIAGVIERWLSTRFLRRLYFRELELLDAVVSEDLQKEEAA